MGKKKIAKIGKCNAFSFLSKRKKKITRHKNLITAFNGKHASAFENFKISFIKRKVEHSRNEKV